tara:strand:- start:195 stop:539 length:345 start_codon:yes stop_codon:yes gene_type:complete
MNILLLFISTCLLSRIILIYVAKNATPVQLRFLSIPAIFLGVYTIRLNVNTALKKDKNKKTSKKLIWWKSFRGFHSFFWILFGILAMKRYNKAYLVLVVDLIISIVSFFHHYFN